jgi:CheY-like chemotaxis protein
MGDRDKPSPELFGDEEIQFGGFDKLMPHRVREILLVAAPYDSFLLADDDRLTELVFSEYLDLNLRYAPRVTRVSTAEAALNRLKRGKRFDLVITMAQVGDIGIAAFAREVKALAPRLPVALLAFSSLEFTQLSDEDRSAFDHIFLWLGDPRIIMAMVKLVEDRLNIDHDIRAAGVQAVLLVEDSVRFYSSYLPTIYSEIMKQTHLLMEEGINLTHKMLRMRARPKILLASSQEEAWSLYQRYRDGLLGVITDVEFPRGGRLDPEAGIALAAEVKADIPDMPVLVQSSEPRHRALAETAGASFLEKGSPSLLKELQGFILTYFGFGDFVFRLPDGTEAGRASDLHSMIRLLKSVPAESIEFHACRNHFSKWLMARTEFELAHRLRPRTLSEFGDAEGLRRHLVEYLHQAIHRTQVGTIVQFDSRYFDRDTPFVKLGSGSIGGKGRGLAFMNFALSRKSVAERFEGVRLRVPNTIVLGTDVFDFFMEQNRLHDRVKAALDDDSLSRAFIEARLPEYVRKDLETLVSKVQEPLAVRSSSLLEDARSMPFAGVYRTYMVPNNLPTPAARLAQLGRAIKLVYASTFSLEARAYLRCSARLPDEEKMAVVIQRVVGQPHGGGSRFYPDISGVVQSYNYYPVPPMRPEDGVAHVALGLGKTIMDGYKSVRFSPQHPESLHQFGSVRDYLRGSQQEFLAVNTANVVEDFGWETDANLMSLGLEAAELDGTLEALGSTYSAEDDAVYDGVHRRGARLVTFAPILKSGLFPLPEILRHLCELGRDAMGSHVEMEFAVNLDRSLDRPVEFYVLQMRAMMSRPLHERVSLEGLDPPRVLCESPKALGNGRIMDVADIVYVRSRGFDPAKTAELAERIGELNDRLRREGRVCLLIGPGRWGSADRWLGIPVKWHQISMSRAIVETTTEDFAVDPSFGTHFFHNVTSLGIGYFTVDPRKGEGRIDWDWLESLPAVFEAGPLRHVRLPAPLDIRVDGSSGQGAILKP